MGYTLIKYEKVLSGSNYTKSLFKGNECILGENVVIDSPETSGKKIIWQLQLDHGMYTLYKDGEVFEGTIIDAITNIKFNVSNTNCVLDLKINGEIYKVLYSIRALALSVDNKLSKLSGLTADKTLIASNARAFEQTSDISIVDDSYQKSVDQCISLYEKYGIGTNYFGKVKYTEEEEGIFDIKKIAYKASMILADDEFDVFYKGGVKLLSSKLKMFGFKFDGFYYSADLALQRASKEEVLRYVKLHNI